MDTEILAQGRRVTAGMRSGAVGCAGRGRASWLVNECQGARPIRPHLLESMNRSSRAESGVTNPSIQELAHEGGPLHVQAVPSHQPAGAAQLVEPKWSSRVIGLHCGSSGTTSRESSCSLTGPARAPRCGPWPAPRGSRSTGWRRSGMGPTTAACWRSPACPQPWARHGRTCRRRRASSCHRTPRTAPTTSAYHEEEGLFAVGPCSTWDLLGQGRG
jgi:hypothetical protein